jgi:SapC
MTNLVQVSRDRFANKGWKRPKDYTFAASEAVVGLVWSEIPAAALAMPIAFMHQEPDTYVPVALTSPRAGRNVFVAPLGQWLGTYVPFAWRTYPFRLLRVQSSDQVVLCIDEDSGRRYMCLDEWRSYKNEARQRTSALSQNWRQPESAPSGHQSEQDQKAKMKLGWRPKTSVEDMIAEMLEADLKRVMDTSSRTQG